VTNKEHSRNTAGNALPSLRAGVNAKNRFAVTPDGRPGLNCLCEGYRMFFSNIAGPMTFMVQE
jgi:sulfatase maturation enzyme AslB (radical SAM superfamily)